MLATGANGGLAPVADLTLFGQRLAPLTFAMDPAFQLVDVQLGLYLLRAIGRIGPDIRTRIGRHQKTIHRLTFMRGRVADMVTLDQLVFALLVHLVLVPEWAFPCFLV